MTAPWKEKDAVPFVPPLCQIALSVTDLRTTEQWFREGLGLLPAGGSRWFMRGPLPTHVQNLPRAASTCWWLVGRNSWFQLEVFQFERPMARLMPHDFRPCDVGYARVGFWVADFDGTLARLQRLGSLPVGAPVGAKGVRRACLRSPDGVYVEVMEEDPLAGQPVSTARPDCGVAARSVTLSVPDLEPTADFLRDGLGLREAAVPLHAPEHEALWGLAGAKTKSRVFVAGDVLVEVVQYLDPVGKRWPQGYRICDQGILNVAFGARNKRHHMEVYRRACAAGGRPNWRPLHLPGAGVVYVNDSQGFSFEVLWMKPGKQDRSWGFEPLPIGQRPEPDTYRIEKTGRFAAPIEKVWEIVTDHEGMADWSGFDQVRLTRKGAPEPNGHGAERWMKGPTGTVTEQVVAWDPPHGYHYRVTESPLVVCHQGEVRLKPMGEATELTWTIRFRPKIPATGGLLRALLGRMLGDIVTNRLKRRIEGAA
jgi:catechol 2,3-dioxygenase-like lactoylglutathione lyase family enzyme/uncharacterized protein YndB with AHSA1/START domain